LDDDDVDKEEIVDKQMPLSTNDQDDTSEEEYEN
jgi:hypothetical protein